MSGLAGLIRFDGERLDPQLIKRMSAAVALRGPDDSGQFTEDGISFTHRLRRFADIRCVQPVVTDRHVVMLDGWIYDHTLPEHLTGPSAPEASDAHTLQVAWERWGRNFTDHVEGDFAAVIWDRHAQRLHLFRDRFGIRPLFWSRSGGTFAFASTVPALVSLPWVSPDPDPSRLAEYLSFQVVHAPRTLLKDVRQVEPGHWLTIDADQLTTRRWWAIRYASPGTPGPGNDEIIDAVQDAVQRSVRRRVPKGVEAGVYLSGGLGSTAIAATARRLHLNLPTFTVSFADDPFPELPFAGRVARLLGLEHHEILVGSSDIASSFLPTVHAMGHPIGNPTGILQGLLGRAARERVGIVLEGDGGPELFGGRMLDGYSRKLQMVHLTRRMPRLGRRLLKKVLGPRGDLLNIAPENIAIELGIGGAHLFSRATRESILADPAWVHPGIRQDILRVYQANLDTDPINTALHGYLRSWLGEGALARADRTAAAAGVDVRFPLLDLEVVSYAASLPGSVKVRRVGGSLHTRWPLRAMLDGVLPAPLVNRPRRGMASPPPDWLEKSGRLFFDQRWKLLQANEFGIFDRAGLQNLRGIMPGSLEVSNQFWSLFILDAWLREMRAQSSSS